MVSLVPIVSDKVKRKLTYKSYNSVVDKHYFPSLGHIHLDLEATKEKVDECWVVEDSISSLANQFVSLLAGTIEIRRLRLTSLSDIDDLFAESKGLPKLIINTKHDTKLTYSEQIMLEIAEKYDVEIRNINHNQLLYLKRNNEKGNYDRQFFPSWEKFIQNNFSHNYQNF